MDIQTIQQLIQENRYNIEILPQLEKLVEFQIQKNNYYLDLNLTILKFYQFYPEKSKNSIIFFILSKALMNLPNNDFLLALYLLSENIVIIK